MNTLIVTDVFEAYYDGRKSEFALDAAKVDKPMKGDEKVRAEAANRDRQPLPRAA